MRRHYMDFYERRTGQPSSVVGQRDSVSVAGLVKSLLDPYAEEPDSSESRQPRDAFKGAQGGNVAQTIAPGAQERDPV